MTSGPQNNCLSKRICERRSRLYSRSKTLNCNVFKFFLQQDTYLRVEIDKPGISSVSRMNVLGWAVFTCLAVQRFAFYVPG